MQISIRQMWQRANIEIKSNRRAKDRHNLTYPNLTNLTSGTVLKLAEHSPGLLPRNIKILFVSPGFLDCTSLTVLNLIDYSPGLFPRK